MSSPSDQRLYITGAGIVSPLGLGWQANEASFRANRTAFRPVDALFDVSQRIAHTAGCVDLPERQYFSKLSPRRNALVDRGTKMLFLAIEETLAQAGLKDMQGVDAMIIGTSAGAMMIGQDYFRHARSSADRLPSQLARLEFYQPQRQLNVIAEELNWLGPMLIVSNACASGANAIGEAMAMIRSGRARRVLAGGYDTVAELVFSGFDCLRALAPSGIPRPFDAARDGLALGEGAGMVLIESAEAAAERGATPLCEAVGYATATDLHHLTQPDPEGKAAIRTMTEACEMAGLQPSQINYINSHGTGTPYNDVAEASAIGAWAGPAASQIAVSSTKSAMGHLLGGAGAVEAVICVMALKGQWMPGSLNVREVDPAVCFDLVRQFRQAPVQAALTNSFGFGGTNASLIFSLPELASQPNGRPATNAPAELHIAGVGAVTSAGWGIAKLAEAMTEQQPMQPGNALRATTVTQRNWPCPVRLAPPAPPEYLPKFPRLRRASPITRFTMAAALEALAQAGFPNGEGAGRLGILQCVFNGCVQFSGKFYQEVLDTPAVASPLIFPETVYNAPTSHVAAFLKADGPVTTLIGESNIVMEAIAMARIWLADGLVDQALILGSEECDWLGAEATNYYHPDLIASEGSGALLLSLKGKGPVIRELCGPHSYHQLSMRPSQMKAVADDLTTGQPSLDALVDSRCGIPTLDDLEAKAWQNASFATVHSPRRILGESMGASGAIQLALAAHLAQTEQQTVAVSMPGTLTAAYGAVIAPA